MHRTHHRVQPMRHTTNRQRRRNTPPVEPSRLTISPRINSTPRLITKTHRRTRNPHPHHRLPHPPRHRRARRHIHPVIGRLIETITGNRRTLRKQPGGIPRTLGNTTAFRRPDIPGLTPNTRTRTPNLPNFLPHSPIHHIAHILLDRPRHRVMRRPAQHPRDPAEQPAQRTTRRPRQHLPAIHTMQNPPRRHNPLRQRIRQSPRTRPQRRLLNQLLHQPRKQLTQNHPGRSDLLRRVLQTRTISKRSQRRLNTQLRNQKRRLHRHRILRISNLSSTLIQIIRQPCQATRHITAEPVQRRQRILHLHSTGPRIPRNRTQHIIELGPPRTRQLGHLRQHRPRGSRQLLRIHIRQRLPHDERRKITDLNRDPASHPSPSSPIPRRWPPRGWSSRRSPNAVWTPSEPVVLYAGWITMPRISFTALATAPTIEPDWPDPGPARDSSHAAESTVRKSAHGGHRGERLGQ